MRFGVATVVVNREFVSVFVALRVIESSIVSEAESVDDELWVCVCVTVGEPAVTVVNPLSDGDGASVPEGGSVFEACIEPELVPLVMSKDVEQELRRVCVFCPSERVAEVRVVFVMSVECVDDTGSDFVSGRVWDMLFGAETVTRREVVAVTSGVCVFPTVLLVENVAVIVRWHLDPDRPALHLQTHIG